VRFHLHCALISITLQCMKDKLGNQSCIRWTVADRRLILSLQRKSGILSVSDLIRQALRALADKQGLTA
jgi:hypothetical protein